MTSLSNQNVIRDDQCEDRLSSLPDEILCHILSFVPAKSAYKMCVFSKRWKHLLTSVPVLDFSEMPRSLIYNRRLIPEQIIYFKKFVNKALLDNDEPELRRIHLCCGPFGWDDDRSCVNSWLYAILKRDIREIAITSYFRKRAHVLPNKLFSRENLVVLKLNAKFAIGNILLLHLPKLEVVHFGGVQFPNDKFMKRLLPCCPVLKELLISHCTGITNMLYIESLSLRRLYILHVATNTEEANTENVAMNTEEANTEKAGIVIKAPNLWYLNLNGTINEHFVCDDLSSLVEANLSLQYEEEDYPLQVLHLVSGVKTLSLTNCKHYRYARKAPVFENLTRLELDNADKLCTFLRHTPNLNCLILKHAENASKHLKYKSIPVCLSSLESVTVYWFKGNENEMEFVSYFLKFASILKEMKIHMLATTIKDVFPKLLAIPSSSTACQIKVIPIPIEDKIRGNFT